MGGDWSQTEPPTGLKRWRDAAGVQWSRRNGGVTVTRLRRLFGDPQVLIVHQYGEEVTAVGAVDRAGLLARVEPFLAGTPDRSPGDQTDFWAAEFKSPDHRSLLVVVETC